MAGDLSLAAVVRAVGRIGQELSASSPTSAALAGGLGYLTARACRASSGACAAV